MVRFILLISIITMTLPMVAQTKYDSIKIFSHPEELPIFNKNFPNRCMEELFEFISKLIIYPETAQEDKIEGQVLVQFWIDTNGLTSEHRIIKSVRDDLDNEVLRIAKLIKFDVPAKNYGKPIGMHYSFPVYFTLVDKKHLRNPSMPLQKTKLKRNKNKPSGCN